jgi:hypothetical protein
MLFDNLLKVCVETSQLIALCRLLLTWPALESAAGRYESAQKLDLRLWRNPLPPVSVSNLKYCAAGAAWFYATLTSFYQSH